MPLPESYSPQDEGTRGVVGSLLISYQQTNTYEQSRLGVCALEAKIRDAGIEIWKLLVHMDIAFHDHQ